MSVQTVVACDGDGCLNRVVADERRKMPEGWRRIRWHIGVVTDHDTPPSGRYDFCSEACFKTFEEKIPGRGK